MTTDYPLNALPAGHVLQGEYRIEGVLGAGGFGITYLARDGFKRPVAIKEYLPNEVAVRLGGTTEVRPRATADEDDFRWGLEKFEEEGRNLAAFEHPSINQVLRLFEAHGTAYLVLEYVAGRTLAEVLLDNGGTLDFQRLTKLLEDILGALQAIHAANLVHCDIKPSNIIIRDEDGSAVLIDFGATRLAVSQRTRSATSAHTPPYAAIEQYEGDSPDLGPWTDLYGLGMVAYRAISGKAEKDLPDAVRRAKWQSRSMQHLDLQPAAEVGAGRYATGLLRAVDWAINVDEHKRPSTAVAMAELMTAPLLVQQLENGQEEASKSPASESPNTAEHERPESESTVQAVVEHSRSATQQVRSWKLIAVVASLVAFASGSSAFILYTDLQAEKERRQTAEGMKQQLNSANDRIAALTSELNSSKERVITLTTELNTSTTQIVQLSRTAEERAQAVKDQERRAREAEDLARTAQQQAQDAEKSRREIIERQRVAEQNLTRRVQLCNQSKSSVYRVAVASFHSGLWFTNGWYVVEPTKCVTPTFRSEVPLLISATRDGVQGPTPVPTPPQNRGLLCIDPVNRFVNLTHSACEDNQQGRGLGRAEFGRHGAGENNLQSFYFN